jgi:small subunit ribosomal protein S8
MDPIGNFLTSIRNASAKLKEKTDVPFSKLRVALAKVLKEEGYISGYRVMEENRIPFVRIQLRYTEARKPVIVGIKRVSRPGLHIYRGWNEIEKVKAGMGVTILSTSKGLMTDRKARQSKMGGEIMCQVW